ncbi:MAG: hypothetical protein NZU63_07000 [Gemmataceae bacterium]|nr:hypothetical protein [Gemmataceae bacterium]
MAAWAGEPDAAGEAAAEEEAFVDCAGSNDSKSGAVRRLGLSGVPERVDAGRAGSAAAAGKIVSGGAVPLSQEGEVAGATAEPLRRTGVIPKDGSGSAWARATATSAASGPPAARGGNS